MLLHKAVPKEHPFQPVTTFPVHTDAFATILQWLHSRIEATRGPAGEAGPGGGLGAGGGAGGGPLLQRAKAGRQR